MSQPPPAPTPTPAQASTVNAALSGDNISVFGGNFVFNQYPSGQAPAVILKLYRLLGPERINTKLWHNSRLHDISGQRVSRSLLEKLHRTLQQTEPPVPNEWEAHIHNYHLSDSEVYRATVVEIAKELTESKSLLGTILLPHEVEVPFLPSTFDPYHIIATLAFQIALNIPGVAENIMEAIECVPWIHELDATTQVNTLLAAPLVKTMAKEEKLGDWKWIIVDWPLRQASNRAISLTGNILTELSKGITREELNINIRLFVTAGSDEARLLSASKDDSDS